MDQCDGHFLLVPTVCSLSLPPLVTLTLESQRVLQLLGTTVQHGHSPRRQLADVRGWAML